MSIHDDSGERLEQLLGVYRTDPDVDFEAAAADEIERLRAEVERLGIAVRRSLESLGCNEEECKHNTDFCPCETLSRALDGEE